MPTKVARETTHVRIRPDDKRTLQRVAYQEERAVHYIIRDLVKLAEAYDPRFRFDEQRGKR